MTVSNRKNKNFLLAERQTEIVLEAVDDSARNSNSQLGEDSKNSYNSRDGAGHGFSASNV